MPGKDGYVIQLYHLFILFGGIAGVFALIHRTWLAPLKAWRTGIDKRITDNTHADELFKAQMKSEFDSIKAELSRGDKEFDELKHEISEMKNCLKSIEKTLIEQAANIQHYINNGNGHGR